MNNLTKLATAAAFGVVASMASASAATLTTYCEDKGSPLSGGAHPGMCDAGEISVGTFDIASFNGGSFGAGQGLVFQGYGDNGDSDVWNFTANAPFTAYLDSFVHSGLGGAGGINAILTDQNGVVTNLTTATAGLVLSSAGPGTYSLKIVGSVSPTALYNYILRVQASEIPLPAGALLFGTALFGAAGLRRKKAAR